MLLSVCVPFCRPAHTVTSTVTSMGMTTDMSTSTNMVTATSMTRSTSTSTSTATPKMERNTPTAR